MYLLRLDDAFGRKNGNLAPRLIRALGNLAFFLSIPAGFLINVFRPKSTDFARGKRRTLDSSAIRQI